MKRGRRPRRRRRYFRPTPKPAKRATWSSATITIGGLPMGAAGSISVRPRRAEEPPGRDWKPYTFETTFTISQPDPGDLRELAWASVVTPSTEAAGAFLVLVDALLERGLILVLVDALLERGLIRPPPTEEEIAEALERAVASGEPVQTTATPKPLLEQAWEWAREATLPPLFERIRLALESVTPPQPPTLETAAGATLDMFAEQLFALRRMPGRTGIDGFGAVAPETDQELRERCRAVLATLRPARSSDAADAMAYAMSALRPDLG